MMRRLLPHTMLALSCLLLTPIFVEGREPTDEEAKVIAELEPLKVRVNWDPQLEGWYVQSQNQIDPANTFKLMRQLGLENIRRCSLSGKAFTDELLIILSEFTSLRELSLIRTTTTAKVFDSIVQLPELTSLFFNGMLDEAGLPKLSECKHLRAVTIISCPITDAALESIGKRTELRELVLREVKVSDVGLAHLAGLQKLTKLELKFTQATDAGLAILANMKELKWLELQGDGFTDAGLVPLAEMKQLDHLSLVGKNFTDGAVEHLTGLANLRHIALLESQATPAGADKLKKLFPNAYVNVPGPRNGRKSQAETIADEMAIRMARQRTELSPAQVEVAGCQAIPSRQDRAWKQSHVALAGGMIFLPPANAGPLLTFTAAKPGYIGLAASWDDEGPLTAEQRQQRKSLGQLLADGWKLAGQAIRKESGDRESRYFLLARKFAAGEKYAVLTRQKTAPFVFQPTQHDLVVALNLQPVTASVETLEKLAPRDPLAGRAAHDLVMVTAQVDPTPGLPLENGYLLGEIVRQAIQLSARHELGLPTLDTASGAKLPRDPQPQNRPLEVVVNAMPQSIEITVLRAQGETLRLAWKHWYGMEGDARYEQLVAQMEQQSRTRLVEELFSAGFAGQAYTIVEQGEVDAKALELLDQLNLVAQFASIQVLHTQIQNEGESPDRLSALARAYANLSLLTEFHFTAAKIVWQARALLYAERLGARWPQSDLALPTRAYTWGMIGRHQTALKILESMDSTNVGRPKWLAPMEVFCKFDLAALQQLGDDATVGALARMLILQSTLGYRDDSFVLQAAESVLQRTPDCYLAIHEIACYSALGTKRLAISLVEQAYATSFAERLLELQYVPEELSALLKTFPDQLRGMDDAASGQFAREKAILAGIQKLREFSGRPSPRAIASGAPGNDVLAAMLDDLVFVHLWWRIGSYKHWFSVPVDDELNAILPHFRYYPLSPVLACMYQDERLVNEARGVAQQRMHPADSVDSWLAFDDSFEFDKNTYFRTIRDHCRRHKDETLYDVRGSGASEPIRPGGKDFPYMVRRMNLVAPHMPATIAWKIETDPTLTLEQGKAYARQYKDSAPVLYALGDRFTFDTKYDLAEACWRRYIRLVKNTEGWRQLANMYLQQNKEEQWLDAMEQALEQPALGLEHASINAEIANHFMARKDFRRALPYSEKAAVSYASFGLLSAAACYEGLQDWTQAEAHFRAECERYPDVGTEWYLFCRRTGQGKRDEAYQLAFDYVGRVERGESESYWGTTAMLYRLDNQFDKALAQYQASVKETPSPYQWLYVAECSDQMGDRERYRAALNQAVELAAEYAKKNPRAPQTEQVDLAKYLLMLLDRPATEENPAGVNSADWENLLKKFSPEMQGEAHYFLASYLAEREEEELAIEHWLKCMSSPYMLFHARTLAGAELLERNITPDDYRAELQTPDKKAQ